MEFNPEQVGGAAVGNVVFRFRECTKNQAREVHLEAFDGCLEFMPSGTPGTMEALICDACGCHRNFHRRERVENQRTFQPPVLRHWEYCCHHGHTGCPHMMAPLPPQYRGPVPDQPTAPTHNVGAMYDPSSSGAGGSSSKRFRTKFTQDQKDRMLAFAQGIGWRITKEREVDVQRFCADMGIDRKVLKVWMHNNKHTIGKML